MAVQIPLRQRYLKGFRSTNKGGERPAPRKSRVKIGRAKHEALYGAPPQRARVVDGRTGKSRMVIL